jgi:iron complex transport system substrate-binding protein
VRIVSLLPGVTEVIYELGLGAQLVGRGRECTEPAAARLVPVVAYEAARAKGGWGAADGEAVGPFVAAPPHHHEAPYCLDAAVRSVRPEVIVTTETCPVCAARYEPAGIGPPSVAVAQGALGGEPVRVVSVTPGPLEHAVDLIPAVAAALGVPERGRALHQTRSARLLALRMHVARFLVRSGAPRPVVAFVEGSAPPRAPRPWIAEMVDAAGGRPAVLARAPSTTGGVRIAGMVGTAAGWPAQAAPDGAAAADVVAGLPAFQPDVLVVGTRAPDIAAGRAGVARLLARDEWCDLPAVRHGRTWLVQLSPDFDHYGPRLIHGVETLIRIIFPEALGANGALPAPHLAVRVEPRIQAEP